MDTDVTFDFHKRHYLPKDILLAGAHINSIGSNLVRYGVGFTVSKEKSQPFDGFGIGNVFIELFRTDAKRSKLITLLFDQQSITLHQIPDRKSIEKTRENLRSLGWIIAFCKDHANREGADCFSKIFDSSPKSAGEYYVYRHIFSDGRMYIGKGKGQRYTQKNGRSSYYARTLEELGEPIIEKLYSELSEDSAYEIESRLIQELKLHYGCSYIINSTEGKEKSGDIGEMPYRTLQVLLLHGKLNLDDARFTQSVNLFMRFGDEIGSGNFNYKSIDIYSAARILKCTMNEVIQAKESSGIVINGFSILSDLEFDEAIAKP
jgi:hypothetical protein